MSSFLNPSIVRLVASMAFAATIFVVVALRDHSPDETDVSLLGKDEAYVKNIYQEFDYEIVFTLKSENVLDLYEYQNGILSACPEIDSGKSVEIKQCGKRISKNIKIIIWLKLTNDKWIVIDNVKYNNQRVSCFP